MDAIREWVVRGGLLLAGAPAFVGAPPVGDEKIEPGPTTLHARSALAIEGLPLRKATEPRWTGDWNAALEEAELRNVPILAVLSDDASSGFQTVSRLVYSTPEFATLSHAVVLVAAFGGAKHGGVKRLVEGREVEWCPLFDCPCDDHRATEVRVRNEFAQREFWNPLHVFVTAAGIELTRAEGHEIRIDRLVEELAIATRERQGGWLDYKVWREVRERIRLLLEQRGKRGAAAVHAELGKLIASERKAAADPKLPRVLYTPGMVAWVERLQAALVEEAEGQIEDAVEAARAGNLVAARRQLAALARETKGLPVEKAALAALAKLPPAEPEKRKGG